MNWSYKAFLALGLWALVSPWLLGFYDINLAAWNSILIGALVILLALRDFSSKK
jgi:hypothetical protein